MSCSLEAGDDTGGGAVRSVWSEVKVTGRRVGSGGVSSTLARLLDDFLRTGACEAPRWASGERTRFASERVVIVREVSLSAGHGSVRVATPSSRFVACVIGRETDASVRGIPGGDANADALGDGVWEPEERRIK